MFKLTYKMLIVKSKWFFFLTVCFAIIISSVFSIFSATQILKKNILNDSFNQYGKFSGVIVNNALDDMDTKEAFFSITGEFPVKNNRIVTVGIINEKFIDLGRLVLNEGRWPQNNQEVVMELAYLKLYDSTWDIGEEREFIINDKKSRFTLVGKLENYTGKWSVQTLYTHFPNMITGHDDKQSIENANMLIAYDEKISKKTNIKNYYSQKNRNDSEGFINDNLVHKGLYYIDFISNVSLVIQIILCFVLIISLSSILSFYLTRQQYNFAVFKSVGASVSHLLRYTQYQITLIYFVGTLLSVPLIVLYHHTILNRLFYYTKLSNYSYKDSPLISLLVFLILTYIISIVVLTYVYKRQFDHSINDLHRKNIISASYNFTFLDSKVRSFQFKQLILQCMLLPRRTIVLLVTMTLSFLLIFLSMTLTKESMIRLEEGSKYYISSQLYSVMKTVDNHLVYLSDDTVFTQEDIHNLETQEGIAILAKSPSFSTIKISMNTLKLVSSIKNWIEKYRLENEVSSPYIAIPNVKFMLANEKFFTEYNNNKVTDLPSVVLFSSSISEQEKIQLIGQTIQLSKVVENNSQYTVENYDLEIVGAHNLPYTITDNDKVYTMDGFVVVIDEAFVFHNAISKGYKEIEILLKDNITPAQLNQLDFAVQSLLAITPGNMVQDIPRENAEKQSFTNLINRIGQLAYVSALFLASIALILLLYGKFELRRRYWGIYRALGMTNKNVFLLSIGEATIYLIIAIIFSLLPILLLIALSGLSYPLQEFIKSLSFGLLIISIVFLLYCLFIIRIVKANSIAMMIKG